MSFSTMSRMLIRAGCPRRLKPRTPRPPPASKPHTEAAVTPPPPSRSHPISPERHPYLTDLTEMPSGHPGAARSTPPRAVDVHHADDERSS